MKDEEGKKESRAAPVWCLVFAWALKKRKKTWGPSSSVVKRKGKKNRAFPPTFPAHPWRRVQEEGGGSDAALNPTASCDAHGKKGKAAAPPIHGGPQSREPPKERKKGRPGKVHDLREDSAARTPSVEERGGEGGKKKGLPQYRLVVGMEKKGKKCRGDWFLRRRGGGKKGNPTSRPVGRPNRPGGKKGQRGILL